MDKPVDPSYLSFFWSVLVALVMALLAIGGFRAKVATKKDLEGVETSILDRLYNRDGSTIYKPRAECDKEQAGCSARICAKLEEMKVDSQRRHDEHMRLHEGLPEFVGSVQQFMLHHHRRSGD